MKRLIILLFIMLVSSGCNGQQVREKQDSAKAPEGSWKVNKEYDEAGNLIRYDSIYSWSSGVDTVKHYSMNHDSVMTSFQHRFYKNFTELGREETDWNNFFITDSIFLIPFFDHDYLKRHFGKEYRGIQEMQEQMEKRHKQLLKYHQGQIDSL